MATSGSSITVTWTSPTLSDNRPHVTGYTVTAVPSSGSTPELLPATATSTVLSGLQRGTVYTIKVVAHSVVGDSMPSLNIKVCVHICYVYKFNTLCKCGSHLLCVCMYVCGHVFIYILYT